MAIVHNMRYLFAIVEVCAVALLVLVAAVPTVAGG